MTDRSDRNKRSRDRTAVEERVRDRLKALLDGDLSGDEAREVRISMERSPEFRAEFEDWRQLFSQLDSLDALSPEPGFSDSVMARVTVLQAKSAAEAKEPFLMRFFRRLGLRASSRDPVITPELIQDYLDGVLPSNLAARVGNRISANPALAAATQEWTALFRELTELPRPEPSAEFAQKVLLEFRRSGAAEVVAEPSVESHTGSPVQSRIARKTVGWLGSIAGDRRQGWAAAAGVAFTPFVVCAVLAYSLFTTPEFNVRDLATFLRFKGDETLAWLAAQLGDGVASLGIQTTLETVTSSPSTLPLLGLSFVVMTVASLWILYRNLISNRTADVRYVQLSF